MFLPGRRNYRSVLRPTRCNPSPIFHFFILGDLDGEDPVSLTPLSLFPSPNPTHTTPGIPKTTPSHFEIYIFFFSSWIPPDTPSPPEPGRVPQDPFDLHQSILRDPSRTVRDRENKRLPQFILTLNNPSSTSPVLHETTEPHVFKKL